MYEENDIVIISGEGEEGVAEYAPDLSVTSVGIAARLKRERQDGDRWARAVRYLYETDCGPISIDTETGEYVPLPAFGDLL